MFHLMFSQRRLCAFATAILCFSVPRLSQAQQIGRKENIEAKIAGLMTSYKVPGVSIAVIKDEKIDWAQGYGILEVGKPDPVTSETRFQAASISKFVSAVGLLSLVEAGKISLDEDVNQKLTSWQVPESNLTQYHKVTLRRLLSHEAGINVHGFAGYEQEKTLPSLLEVLNGNKTNSLPIQVDFAPGSKFQYSGGGYCIAQQLAIDITGQSFPDFMQSAVLDKVDMSQSSFQQPLRPDWQPLVASAHNDQGQVINGHWHNYPELAAAGLWTTPTDIAKLAIEVEKSAYGRSNKIFSEAVCQAMLTKQKGYGLGVELSPHRFSHSGINAGFQSYFVCLDSGEGAVIMTNADGGLRLCQEVMQTIAEQYGWDKGQTQN